MKKPIVGIVRHQITGATVGSLREIMRGMNPKEEIAVHLSEDGKDISLAVVDEPVEDEKVSDIRQPTFASLFL